MPTLEERVKSLEGWRLDVAREFRGLEEWRQEVEAPLEDVIRWHRENEDWLEVFRSDLIYRQRKESDEKKSHNARNIAIGIFVTLYLAMLQTVGTFFAISQMKGR